ncbi:MULTISPECIES: hypothetical protein [unclassified Acinetobacter]|uniref:hypothetical protein n=1 Tax=unclassified Acinetobacter TaxID=196816 RepID=UPI00211EA0F0|nr:MULTISPECIES: hypothetical protein [unclassified Acinetobacter]
MLGKKRSNRLDEMVKQQECEVCNQCDKELQLKVKFCPFCSAAQSVQTPTLPVIPEEKPTISKDIVSKVPTPAVSKIVSEEAENEAALSVVVKHITKQGKELVGIIVVGASLELMRTYDRYAFKKEEGIFIRLKHLARIPNEFLSSEQYKLKSQNDLLVQDNEPDEYFEQTPPVASVESPLPSKSMDQQTPLDSPQPKNSIFKYIAISFAVFFIGIVIMFSGNKDIDQAISVDEGPLVDSCENVNAEVSSLLSEKMPMRALSIIKLNQEECKTNASFVQLVVSAEAQATSAKEKLTLAKEYLQAGNLELAHQTLLAALELDSELVGGVELLPQIESMIEEYNLQQEQELDGAALESEAAQVAVQSVPQQNINHGVEQEQRLAQAERERAEAQRQAEQSQRQAEQAQRERQQTLEKERQKAEEVARKQATEAARKQNEERFDSQLSRAERALNANNYGLAKSLAREVLSKAPSNAQAKRILRQAESGEAAAFDEMVIQ